MLMQHFIGTYECKADIKGRIMLPSALKKQLSSKLDKGFVLKRAVFNHCLELYPLLEWEGLMNRINKLDYFKWFDNMLVHLNLNSFEKLEELNIENIFGK